MEDVIKGQRIWLWILAGLIVLLTCSPYALAFTRAEGGWEFSGFLLGVEDGNSYIAKMLRGSQGDWLFRTPYTHLPQTGVLVFLPYLLLGKLVGGEATHLQLVALFHLFRAAVIPLAVFATYRFAALFLRSTSERRWATVLAVAGGGLGWLAPLLGWGGDWKSTPLAFLSPETFGFLGLLALPHQGLARALMLLALVNYTEALESGRSMLRGGVLGLACSLVNPLTGVSLFVIIGLHQIAIMLRWGSRRMGPHLSSRVRHMARFFLPASPYFAYLLIARTTDPFLQSWAEQNRVLSPPIVMYLLAYAVVALPAFCGIWKKIRNARQSELLPIAWILILPFLIYAPLSVQRRLPEGSWVAVSVATAWGLRSFPPQLQRLARPLILALSLSATGILVVGVHISALRPSPPAFERGDYAQAYQLLGQVAGDGDVVLSAFGTANALPAWAPVRVPIGHGPESVRLEEMQLRVIRFYQEDGTVAARMADELGASWFLWGPRESELSGHFEYAELGEEAGHWGEVILFSTKAAR